MALIEKRPPWFDELRHALAGNWTHHGPCSQVSVTSHYNDETGEWQIIAAPVFQEVYGGEQDGMKVWTSFVFDFGGMSGLFGVPGMVIQQRVEARSYCVQCSPAPMLVMKGKYNGETISLQIRLEPIADSEAVEIIDTIHCCLRSIGSDDQP